MDILLHILIGLVALTANADATCQTIKDLHPTAQSGMYHIWLPSGNYQVYCEMAINGGGYTFLPSSLLAKLQPADLRKLFKKQKDVLLRISKPDGTQPYTIIRQYRKTGGLSIQLNNHAGYTKPVNTHLGPYIFLGTLPSSHAKNRHHQGFKSNGQNVIFTNCDRNPNNYFAFFSNPYERRNSKYHANNLVYERTGVAVGWRATARRPYSGRRMPLNFFLLTEMHFGGCGTYTSSDRWLHAVHPALGTAIGLR